MLYQSKVCKEKIPFSRQNQLALFTNIYIAKYPYNFNKITKLNILKLLELYFVFYAALLLCSSVPAWYCDNNSEYLLNNID